MMKRLLKSKGLIWDSLRSPKTISLLKLGAAVVGLIHAIDEFKSSSKSGKNAIGFKMEDAAD